MSPDTVMFPDIGDGLPEILEKQILEEVPSEPAAPTANIVADVQVIVLETADAVATRFAVAAHNVNPGDGDVPGVNVHPVGAAEIVFVAQV